jgi:hypothetical protein
MGKDHVSLPFVVHPMTRVGSDIVERTSSQGFQEGQEEGS